MFKVIESTLAFPRGFYWTRTFATRQAAEAAIDAYLTKRSSATPVTLRINFERRVIGAEGCPAR